MNNKKHSLTNSEKCLGDSFSLNRRNFLTLGAVTAGSSLIASTSAHAHKKINTSAKIVIAGAGAAGLAAASQLSARLDGAEIILVDGRKQHFYQPGFTLVAGGVKGKDYPLSTTKEHVANGVSLIEEHVAEFDPDSNSVTTTSGKKISYDYLMLTTGLKLDYQAIAGMDESLIGKNGLGSIYHSPQAAFATWKLLDKFADNGGTGVFLRPSTGMKCAGAPLKYTFITHDHLIRRGNRRKAKLIYNAHNNGLFGVPIVSEKVRMLFAERDIDTHYNRVLTSIDAQKRIATFTSKDEGEVELHYDFINVVPPMRAVDAVLNSPLPFQSGKQAVGGWLEVSKQTLRHARYHNVFGIGDIAGVPKGKTAASVKWQVPVAVDHLVAEIDGKTSNLIYNGYTSCPLITRLGRAMLIEFDYQNNLVPSFPGIIAPLEELWVTWVIKTMALKPTYINMLHGKA